MGVTGGAGVNVVVNIGGFIIDAKFFTHTHTPSGRLVFRIEWKGAQVQGSFAVNSPNRNVDAR